MTDDHEDELQYLIAEARTGSEQAIGDLFTSCTAYLHMVAQQKIDPQLTAKGGVSDLLQETFIDAQKAFGQFKGDSETELLAWLRKILEHNVINFGRTFRQTAKRDIARERSLAAADSSLDLHEVIPSSTKTPSKYLYANEQREQLEEAIRRLSEDDRRIIQYRYREGKSFKEIAELMGRSANAASKLFAGAIERLRRELSRHDRKPLS